MSPNPALSIKPHDVLRIMSASGVEAEWIVSGVHLGGDGQESAVEITRWGHEPPGVDGGKMFVPVALIEAAVNGGLATINHARPILYGAI